MHFSKQKFICFHIERFLFNNFGIFGYTTFGDLKMNKKIWLIIAILLMILIVVGIYFYTQNTKPSNNENDYEANRTSTSTSENNETQTDENANQNLAEQTQGITEAQNEQPPVVEEQIATFTTKIYSNDPARQNNISITCNTLNGTTINNGATFSFCGTVGQSSTSKGYQKADIFDKNGNKKKGLGGRKLSN